MPDSRVRASILGLTRALLSAMRLQRGFVGQEVVDSAADAMRRAAAQLALDQATVLQHAAQWKAPRINLAYTNIVAPVDGTVVARNVNQGQTVVSSFQTPTLFLVATDLTLTATLTRRHRIRPGTLADFTVKDSKRRQYQPLPQSVPKGR
jgi:HlyD family secretion protein